VAWTTTTIDVPSHDLASVVGPIGPGVVRTGEVDGAETVPVPHEAVNSAAREITSDDLASDVDPIGNGLERAREIDRGVIAVGTNTVSRLNLPLRT